MATCASTHGFIVQSHFTHTYVETSAASPLHQYRAPFVFHVAMAAIQLTSPVLLHRMKSKSRLMQE